MVKILFIENEGMAWGTEIPGAYGKLFFNAFRLVAVGGIGYWLWDSVERKDSSNYLIAVALILAAFGNIIDCFLRCNF
jgi:signal peptidase II